MFSAASEMLGALIGRYLDPAAPVLAHQPGEGFGGQKLPPVVDQVLETWTLQHGVRFPLW